jgi:hypothetical protein
LRTRKPNSVRVGSAKKIWDNRPDSKVNVDEDSLALALNQAEARRKLTPLPGYEEDIRKAIVGLTPNPPEVWKKAHITVAHCNLMRAFFKMDLELSEQNYKTWKPFNKNGAPM